MVGRIFSQTSDLKIIYQQYLYGKIQHKQHTSWHRNKDP